MVLYHVVSTYHLLCAMIHNNNHKEDATVAISEWLVQKFPNIHELNRFFDKVVVTDANFRFFHSCDETEKYYASQFGNLKTYSDIYIWGTHFSLSLYCAEKNISFIACEDGAGLFSRPQIIKEIDKDGVKKELFDEMCTMGLYDGTGSNISALMCNIKAQVKHFSANKPVIDFDAVQTLCELTPEKRNAIIQFFVSLDTIHIPDRATLLLSQHFANLGTLNFEQQVLIYQLFVDYFVNTRKLVIKTHPDDLMYYQRLFPETQIVREKFPSEFMPFILDNQPDCVATISSTAIYNLRGHYPKVFELDSRYEKDFAMTHRYYTAVVLAERLVLPILCVGANEILAQRLVETLNVATPEVSIFKNMPDEPCMLLIDDVTEQGEAGRKQVRALLDKLPAESCAVFINSKGDFCWYDYDRKDLWENIVPITLKKQRLSTSGEDFYASLDEETIYVYSKDKELLHMVKATKIEKDLPYTGLHISTPMFTPEQERIKVLEGILAATEQRLVYYIEKEREKK